MLRIYLARHGQTAANAIGRLQGHTDIPLDAIGEAQARGMAERLRGIDFAHIYCSQLRRARQTAAAVADGGQVPFTELADLNERALGCFEGQVLADDAARATYYARIASADDELDGGESSLQHVARVRRAFDRIRTEHASGDVLVVAHGGTNVMALHVVAGLELDVAWQIRQHNAEVILIELDGAHSPRLWRQMTTDTDASGWA